MASVLAVVAHEALARYERAFKSDETVLEPGGWYGPCKDGGRAFV